MMPSYSLIYIYIYRCWVSWECNLNHPRSCTVGVSMVWIDLCISPHPTRECFGSLSLSLLFYFCKFCWVGSDCQDVFRNFFKFKATLTCLCLTRFLDWKVFYPACNMVLYIRVANRSGRVGSARGIYRLKSDLCPCGSTWPDPHDPQNGRRRRRRFRFSKMPLIH